MSKESARTDGTRDAHDGLNRRQNFSAPQEMNAYNTAFDAEQRRLAELQRQAQQKK